MGERKRLLPAQSSCVGGCAAVPRRQQLGHVQRHPGLRKQGRRALACDRLLQHHPIAFGGRTRSLRDHQAAVADRFPGGKRQFRHHQRKRKRGRSRASSFRHTLEVASISAAGKTNDGHVSNATQRRIDAACARPTSHLTAEGAASGNKSSGSDCSWSGPTRAGSLGLRTNRLGRRELAGEPHGAACRPVRRDRAG